jgi:hypothetical protein
LHVNFVGAGRAGQVVADAAAEVELSWAAFVLPSSLTLMSHAAVPLEPWRSHS